MQEFVADKKIGKKLYKQKRKQYARYKTGMTAAALLVIGLIAVNFFILMHASDSRQVLEGLLIGIGFDVVFFIGICFARALAVSGGREVLMSRMAERCWFTEEAFILEYIPGMHERAGCKKIQYRMEYRDMEKVTDDSVHGRMALFGKYTVLKYQELDENRASDSYEVSDMPVYIYEYYKDYDLLKNKLMSLAGR